MATNEYTAESHPNSVENYHRVKEAWPLPARNPQNSWAVHVELAEHPDRFELIKRKLTLAEARYLMAHHRTWAAASGSSD